MSCELRRVGWGVSREVPSNGEVQGVAVQVAKAGGQNENLQN